jgi:hypothetical protein
MAESDSTATLAMDGDDITLTSPSGTVYAVQGQYIRRGMDIDPGTGLQVAGNVSAFTVSLSALALLGLLDFDDLKDAGWTVEARDVTGKIVRAKLSPGMLDRTIGRVTFAAKV